MSKTQLIRNSWFSGTVGMVRGGGIVLILVIAMPCDK